MNKLVNKEGNELFPLETGKVNSYLSYIRVGRIVNLHFSKTYSSTSNTKEVITTALPFSCGYARNGISLLVGTTLVGHASIYVIGNEVGVNLASYSAAVTAQGNIICFIED